MMLTVETWPLERLIPYARNPRKNDGAVSKMCSAIREFGFKIPIVARSDGTVVDGHLRLKAAQQLGLGEVPVALADDLSEAQIKAFRLLANRSAAWAEWDDELLTLELQDLQGFGYDLGLTGFDVAELRGLLDEAPATGLTDEDAIPETPASPVTRPGDLILLGSHRLLCGDATRADDVARLLDGAHPHLMVTDPPYGVDYDPAWRNEAGVSATHRTGRVANDDRADWREAWALFPGAVAYIWHAAVHATTVAESLVACGFDIRAQLIWSKNRFALGRGDYHWQHEPCWYAARKGARSHWQGPGTSRRCGRSRHPG
jgi:ParB/Sulfiredoxin domain